jgi:hypothetical protein
VQLNSLRIVSTKSVSTLATNTAQPAANQLFPWNMRNPTIALNLHSSCNVHAPRSQTPRACSVRACSVFLGRRRGPPPRLRIGCARAARAYQMVPLIGHVADDTDCATASRRRTARRFNEHALGVWERSLSPRRTLAAYWSASRFALGA